MPYVPASDLEAIEALYIGYFGRAGEPGGVNYWVERMEDGMTFAEVAASFSVQPEAKAQHPFLANPATGDAEAFVASLYSQLLNRDDAKTADPTGFKYWVDALKAAQGDTLDIGLLIAQFISGAQGIDIQTIQNKVAGAIYFTQELEAAGITGVDSKGQVTAETKEIGAAVVDGITSNPASVAESREETDAYVEDGTIPDPSGGGGNPGGGGGNPGGGGGSGSGTGIIFNVATGVLTLNDARDYSVTASSADGFEVRIDGVVRETYSAANLAALTEIHVRNAGGDLEVAGSFLSGRNVVLSGAGSFNLTAVNFTEASATSDSNKFEPNVKLDSLISSSIAKYGNISELFQHLQVNGGAVGAFQLLWDYIDDNYSYYNNAINESGIRLGLEYVAYLQAGGQPLTDITVKYAPDDVDAGSNPNREQSLHDNLLGNLHGPSIKDKLAGSGQGGSNPSPTPGQYDAMVDLIDDEAPGILARGIVTGNEIDIGNAAYNSALAYDYEQGWARPDYISFTTDGEGDARAIDTAAGGGRYLFVGTGIPADQMATVENVGAGVELSFGIRHWGSTAYNATSVTGNTNGAHFIFNVEDGVSPLNANRAEWTFNPIVVAGTNGQLEDLGDFRFELDIDLDPGAGTRFLRLVLEEDEGANSRGQWVVANGSQVGTVGAVIIPDNEGTEFTSQNSHNFAFYQTLFDVDPVASGNQPYTYGPGRFEFELRAYDGANLVGVNHTTVNVVA